MFPTLHPAPATLKTDGSCRFAGPFSARGSLAETEASQRLVVAIKIILARYHISLVHDRLESKRNIQTETISINLIID